ncbi:MAG TPA: glycosyltransferase [Solirubrobacteraceae bacterium]|nr:glycosyltransferase [Solirubrobacteraceae bacterium]
MRLEGEPKQPLASVVIPAHNEASVIRRCLDRLFTGIVPGEIEVIVVCNGCRDETAEVARSSGHPVQVLELRAASKSAALRAGDAVAQTFPRLYLDADVVLSGTSVRRVAERLSAGAVAARPPVVYSSSASSAAVRRYFRARSRMPSLQRGLWGAGVYGVSAAGRARFGTFPDITADDLWIDLLFERAEVEIVDCEPVVVAVPHRTRDLAHVLRRAYRGQAENGLGLRGANRARGTTGTTLRDIRRLALSGPAAAVDAAIYASFAAGVRVGRALEAAAGRGAAADQWERDESSRVSGA